MLQVVLDRRVGDLRLPARRAGVLRREPARGRRRRWDLTPPMANRLMHIDHQPEVDVWIDGMTAGFTIPAVTRVAEPSPARAAITRAAVAAFIRTRRDLLHVLPSNDTAIGRAWPSRRTWTMTADVLALLPTDDTDAAYLAAAGLVGDGAATEFLTWRRAADLPDPADVIADPPPSRGPTWTPPRVWAVLAGVVGYCTGRGTVAAWREAWGPLAAAADNARGDVAAACARQLLTARPNGATPPREVRRFATVLADAGLLGGAA
jgi:hypothetical protein